MQVGSIYANSKGGTYAGMYCPGWGDKGYITVNFDAPAEAPSGWCTVTGNVYWTAIRGYNVAGGWPINIWVAGQQRTINFPGVGTLLQGGSTHYLGTVSWWLQAGPGFNYAAELSSGMWFTWYLNSPSLFKQSPGNVNGGGSVNLSGVVVQKYYHYVWNGSSWQKRTPKKYSGGRWVDTVKYVWNGSSWQEKRI